MEASKNDGDELAEDFVNAYNYHKALIEEDKFKESNLLWFRLWNIVQKTDNKPIGVICFKDPVNAKKPLNTAMSKQFCTYFLRCQTLLIDKNADLM